MPGPLTLSRRGLEAVKGSRRVYLEAYTSVLLVPKEKLVRERGGMVAWRAGWARREGLQRPRSRGLTALTGPRPGRRRSFMAGP